VVCCFEVCCSLAARAGGLALKGGDQSLGMPVAEHVVRLVQFELDRLPLGLEPLWDWGLVRRRASSEPPLHCSFLDGMAEVVEVRNPRVVVEAGRRHLVYLVALMSEAWQSGDEGYNACVASCSILEVAEGVTSTLEMGSGEKCMEVLRPAMVARHIPARLDIGIEEDLEDLAMGRFVDGEIACMASAASVLE